MSKSKLTRDDFCRAAKRLRCDVAAVKAVAEVESRGEPFYSDGFPVILFERHKFREFTKGAYNKSHPELSGPAGNYGKAGQNQRNKFNKAFALNATAAMKSCSFGMFQIMGFNHAVCGFATVGEFVDAMKESAGRQLDAFVNFVINNGLADELRNLNWAAFARGYNGTAYKKNKYDTKMATAYRKYKAEGIDCSQVSAAASSSTTSSGSDSLGNSAIQTPTADPLPIDPQTENPGVGEITAKRETDTPTGTESLEVTSKNEQDVNTPAVIATPEPYNGIGFTQTIKNDAKAILPANVGLQTVSEVAEQATSWPEWIGAIIAKLAIVALVATVGWVLFRIVHYVIDTLKKNAKVRIEAEAATSTVRKDIEWK